MYGQNCPRGSGEVDNINNPSGCVKTILRVLCIDRYTNIISPYTYNSSYVILICPIILKNYFKKKYLSDIN